MLNQSGSKSNWMSVKQWALAGAASLVIVNSTASAQASEIEFDIDATNLGDALNEFGMQSGKEIIFIEAETAGKTSNDVEGVYAPDEALNMLLDGSGIEYRTNELGTVLVGKVAMRSASLGEEPTQQPFRVAQLDQEEGVREVAQEQDFEDEKREDVIIVTGTNIRGVSSASPVQSFNREDIDLSGQLTVTDFIQTIPQNFTGELSESSLLSGNGPGGNLANATGANLRGLGADSTLVLINGRRSAPSGGNGFVDLSLIPLAAVQRVDVLTDGASAIYGSDAVGGVINIILKDRYDGAETSVRYGSVTDGDNDEFQASQVFGRSWDSGSALVSYEYYKQNSLESSDREFTEDALPFNLVPDNERHSVFFSTNQDISSNINLFATGNFSVRDVEASTDITGRPTLLTGTTEQYGGTLGSTVSITDEWQAEIVGLYSITTSDVLQTFPTLNRTTTTKNENETLSIEGKVDGPVISLPGGDLRLAAGAGYRNEKFADGSAVGVPDLLEQERDVSFLFGELFVPIVGDGNSRPGIERLELTLAGRFEDYSDFGSTSNPKIGLLWSPTDGFVARSTFSTSFRAPRLPELSPGQNIAFYTDVVDPLSMSGSNLSLFLIGLSTVLEPEEAETFTVGLDLNPPAIPGFSASVTYFDINYTDRIATPTASNATALVNPLFEPLIQRDPSLADIDATLAELDTLVNFSGLSDADARTNTGVIIDRRLANFAVTKVDGLDFNLGYQFDTTIGTIALNTSGSYLFNFDERIFQNAPDVSVLNTYLNPIDLRLRNSITWSHDGWSSAIFVNHAASYTDDSNVPERAINSFNTVDFTLAYNTGDISDSILSNTRFAFSATNLFDEDPPFVDQFRDVNFDPANASPIGRFLAFQITKAW